MEALRLENVTKTFDKVQAVSDLSLSVPAGKVYGFLGPNGAGKTTTLRMLLQIILPDSGSIHILGQSNSREALDRVGYLPEERGVYRKMKVHEALEFFGALKGIKRKDCQGKIDYWLARFEMTTVRAKKMEELSKGNQQKIQFLTTVLHEPDLIVLDEPFMGLDPINALLLKEILLEQKARGAAIIFSTHLMDEAEKLCDSICLINKGRKVLDGELKTIKRNFGKRNIVLSYSGTADYLKDASLVKHYNDYGNHVEISLHDGASYKALLQKALQQSDISRFEMVEPSLNEIFIATVTQN
jgi:ABC-2 type transport system ATP-binding protein